MQPEDQLIAHAIELGRSGHVRVAAGMLRERLLRDRGNEAVRAAIIEVYRAGGHADQVGRYAFAFGAYNATQSEPYLRHLVAARADEARIRQLSALPDGIPIPEEAVARMAEMRAAQTAHEPWDSIAGISWAVFSVIAGLTLVLVYVIVILGGDVARTAAGIGGALAIAAAGAASLGMAGGELKNGRPMPFVIWGGVSLILFAVCVFAVVALVV